MAVTTTTENFTNADLVFVAHVFRLEEIGRDVNLPENVMPMSDLNASFRLIDSIKGDAPRSGMVESSSANCFVPLVPGDYVIFADRDDSGRMTVLTIPEGTRWYSDHAEKSIEYVKALKRLSSTGIPHKP